MCFAERPSKDSLSSCDLDGWAAKCDSAQPESVLAFLASAQEALDGKKGIAERGDAIVRLLFGMAKALVDESSKLADDQKRAARESLAALEDLMLGLVTKDWVRAVSGGTRVAAVVIAKTAECKLENAKPVDEKACDELGAGNAKLLTLVGAIGNYALTYKTSDPKQAQADREAIMTELVDRMVSRTSKERGFKFSLGGGLGVLAGARTDTKLDAAQWTFPAQLGLGFGLQSYHRSDAGFHLMVTLLDLGQYVTMHSGKLDVSSPDIESAVTLGLSLGGWLWNRELPLYIAAYGGYSPFVRTKDNDRPTLQVGLSSGFYVPLLDFN
jgi:hypothetical protein